MTSLLKEDEKEGDGAFMTAGSFVACLHLRRLLPPLLSHHSLCPIRTRADGDDEHEGAMDMAFSSAGSRRTGVFNRTHKCVPPLLVSHLVVPSHLSVWLM